jgi:hypothetical protein
VFNQKGSIVKFKLLAVTAVLGLVACSSTVPLVEKKAEWVQGSSVVDKNMAPDWFTMHLTNDDKNIFAVATEYSADYQFAIDRAMMIAKVNLAAQINQRVESEMNSYIRESGTGGDVDDINRSVERKSRTVVDTTQLVGYKRDKLEVRREGKGYRVYLRLIYDYTDANLLTQNAIKAEKRKIKQDSTPIPKPNVSVTPVETKSLSQRAAELPHNTVSDAAVKKQAEDAIARGDAVIVTKTIQ